MLPTKPSLSESVESVPGKSPPRASITGAGGEGDDGPRDRLEPIGPERLQALREAICNGTYPAEDDVLSGLTSLFTTDEPED